MTGKGRAVQAARPPPLCYPRASFFAIFPDKIMLETNHITARIADLTARAASLRGYL